MEISSLSNQQAFKLQPNGADASGIFSFSTLLDAINPLQHIPIISTLYQQITGDKPAAISQLAGGALFGGPLGLLFSGANVAVEKASGNDIGGHIYTAFTSPTDASRVSAYYLKAQKLS